MASFLDPNNLQLQSDVKPLFKKVCEWNPNFYQVPGIFIKYFSFYGPKTIQKWSFFDPKTPKIHARALQYLKNYMEF